MKCQSRIGVIAVLRLAFGLGIAVSLFTIACVKGVDLRRAQSASMEQVREYVYGPMGHYSDLFSGVFYVGSDSSFDYIAVKQGRRITKLFRVKRGDLGVMRRTGVDADDQKWLDITGMFPVPNNPGQP
jgi:hypothetical protein